MLDAVTDAMVALHLHDHGCFPATAETVMLGEDLLACTLAGIHGDPDDPWIDFWSTEAARHGSQTAPSHSDHAYVEAVQRLSGRTVLAFISNHDAETDIWTELFWLAPAANRTHGPPASDGLVGGGP